MCDIFLFLYEGQFAGYAGDNTPFVVRGYITNMISDLEEEGDKL